MKLLNQGKAFFKTTKGLYKLKTASDLNSKSRAAKALSQTLGQEKGLLLKIGQLINDGNPNTNDFSKTLLENTECLSITEVKEIIEEAYNKSTTLIFSNIDEQALGASIGQVHKAKLINGSEVAIKIKYPYIDETIKDQMALLNLLPNIGPAKKWGIPLDRYKELISSKLSEELSYSYEAEKQLKYKQQTNKLNNFLVPDVFTEFTKDHIFVQQWMDGVDLSIASSWPIQNKNIIAESLMTHFFYQFFVNGFLHIDPHPGNYLFSNQEDPTVILIDYGSCHEFPDDFKKSLLKLILACRNKEDIDPIRFFKHLGFDINKLQHIHNLLPKLTEVLFEPFCANYPYNVNDWNLSKRVESILGDYKWWFRSSGSDDFFILMKSFLGLVHQLESLNVNLNWMSVLEKSTGQFLYEASTFSPEIINIKQDFSYKLLAQKLIISVKDGDVEKVKVTLPITAVEELDSYIDEDVKLKIEQRGVVITKVISDFLTTGGYPTVLFNLEDSNKTYKIWTE